MASSGRKLYYWSFFALMGSSETFGRAFLHPKTLHRNVDVYQPVPYKTIYLPCCSYSSFCHFKLNSKCYSTQWLRVLWDFWRCKSCGM